MKNRIGTSIMGLGLLLGACGGGGGGGSSTPAPSAEGFWIGTSSSGWNLQTVVLENNEFWNIFSVGGVAYGIDHGTVTTSGNTYSGNISEFYIPNNSVATGTVSGSFVQASTLTGTTVSGSTTTTFSETYNSAYNNPASLTALAGTYVGNYYTGYSVSVAISSAGAILGTSANCSFSGTATPRSSGKDVFNVSLSFTGTGCAPGTSTASGIGVLNTVGSYTYLYTAGITPGGNNGFFWVGQKQ